MKKMLIILFLLLPVFLQAQHDPQVVREKLKSVLSELDDSPRKSYEWNIPPFWKNFFRILGEGHAVFRILFFLGIGAIVFFILYRIIGSFLRDRIIGTGMTVHPPPQDGIAQGKGHTSFMSEAATAFSEGEYSRAIVLLHRGSVQFLYGTGILDRSREYTNREIAVLLGTGETAAAFVPLAGKAEHIVFAGGRGGKEEYLRFEDLCRRHFT